MPMQEALLPLPPIYTHTFKKEELGILALFFQGQRKLVGFSSWGSKDLDTTEQLTHTHTILDTTFTPKIYDRRTWFI